MKPFSLLAAMFNALMFVDLLATPAGATDIPVQMLGGDTFTLSSPARDSDDSLDNVLVELNTMRPGKRSLSQTSSSCSTSAG